MRRDTFVHLFGAVCILLTALFLPTALSSVEGQSAEPTEAPGIPRDAYYARQISGAGFEAQAAIEPLPATLRNAFLKGGIALVFGCYDDQGVNMHEFDAELPLIAAAGAGHVRLTCSIGTFEQGTSGQLNEARYQDLRSFINLAWSYGLTTTVDFHIFRTREPGQDDWSSQYQWHVGDTALENRAISVISETARRLSEDIPVDRFAIQPANEPIDEPGWYPYQNRLFAAIRAACAQCTIAVMADDWQGDQATIDGLNLGAFSGPTYVDVHWYSPIGLSHCTYPGTANNCPGKQYPGTYQDWRGTLYYDQSWFAGHLQSLATWAQQRGVFINIGEFGTADALAQDVRARYLGDLARVFRQFGWGFTAYEWHHNFGIKQHPQVVSALFQPGAPVTPVPTAIVPTNVVPTNIPPTATSLPGQPPANIDIDELIRLAQVVAQRRQEAQTAEGIVTSAQSAYQIVLEQVQASETALRDYVLGWVGE